MFTANTQFKVYQMHALVHFTEFNTVHQYTRCLQTNRTKEDFCTLPFKLKLFFLNSPFLLLISFRTLAILNTSLMSGQSPSHLGVKAGH